MTALTSIDLQNQIFNQSAFGELIAFELQGIIQLQFTYNLSPELTLQTISGTGTVISQPPFAVLSVAGASSSASIQSRQELHYGVGQGVSVVFSAMFTNGVADTQQYVGAGNLINGLFFGWNGTTFGILYVNDSVPLWIYQSSWNIDPFDGTGESAVTLNPANGNIYKIQFQGLGFGVANFFIENGNDGTLTLVHQVQYLNEFINPASTYPTLPLFAYVQSTTSATPVQISVPSMATFIEGNPISNDNTLYAVNGQIGITGGAAPALLLVLLNNVTFNGYLNSNAVTPKFISMATTGTASAAFTFLVNPSVSVSYNQVNTSAGFSIASYAVGGTIYSSGKPVATQYIGANSYDNVFLPFSNFNLKPGDILAVTASSSSNATVSASFSWLEQF